MFGLLSGVRQYLGEPCELGAARIGMEMLSFMFLMAWEKTVLFVQIIQDLFKSIHSLSNLFGADSHKWASCPIQDCSIKMRKIFQKLLMQSFFGKIGKIKKYFGVIFGDVF